jgi:hypothetical protein
MAIHALVDLYSSPNNIRVIESRIMRWEGSVARLGRGEAYTGFWWGNLREKDHLEEKRRREDNIKIDLQEVGCGDMDWIELAQDRDRWWTLATAAMILRFP